MRGNFSCFWCCLLTLFRINFFEKFFQVFYQSGKLFGSGSGPKFYRGQIWVQTFLKGYQQMIKVAASKDMDESFQDLSWIQDFEADFP